MGISKSKQTTTNDPATWAKQPILDSLAATRSTFDRTQPELEGYASTMRDAYGRRAPGAEAGVLGAQNLVNSRVAGDFMGRAPSTGLMTRTAGGAFLDPGSNPGFQTVLDRTNRGITDSVASAFEGAGRYGSAGHAGALAKAVGDASGSLIYGNYNDERARQMQAAGLLDQNYQADLNRQDQAVGDAQGLMGGSLGLLNNAATLPWEGVRAQNGGVSGLTSGYGTRTQSQSPSLIQGLGDLSKTAGSIAGTAMLLSDPRAKENEQLIDVRPDGLGVYRYNYKPEIDPTQQPQIGVMADEVAAKRPDALGPTVGGLQTVDYGQLDAPAAAPAPAKKRGLFGRMADGLTNIDASTPEGRRKLLGAYLAAASGNPLGEAVLGARKGQRDDEDASWDRRYREAQIAELLRKARQPKTAQVGNTIGIIDEETGGFTPTFTAPREEPSLIREMMAAGIDPKSEEGRKIIARSASGYQYSDEAQQQRIITESAIARARAAAAAANRAPPKTSAPKLPAGFILDN